MSELEEYRFQVISLYDEWLDKLEGRSVSYGELSYFQDKNKKELEILENEIIEELEKLENGKISNI